MIINVNLPNHLNSPTPGDVDGMVQAALIKPVCERSVSFLRGRPKVAPYYLGSVHGRIVTFIFIDVFNAASSKLDNATALEAMMAGLVDANCIYLAYERLPKLYHSGVIYKRTTIWDSYPGVLCRMYGDCKSLAAARIAELKRDGIDSKAVFRWNPRDDGTPDFHILIQSVLGLEDPSRLLGMGADENAYFKKGA